jgi:hypothetical protein
MKKYLMKIFTPLLVLLITMSLIAGVFPAIATNQPADEYTNFMEKVLTVDVSKYTIELTSNFTSDAPLSIVDRKITYLQYELNSEQSGIIVLFRVEKGIISSCSASMLDGKVLTTQRYSNPLDAAKDFLERYQAYTNIDSSRLITMLDNVDITKNSTITIENMKLTVTNIYVGEIYQTSFLWSQVVNGADYDLFDVAFDKDGNFITMGDSREIFIIGDTSVNISQEQAIDIALENLQFYSYEMSDGSVVKDFKVSKDGVIAKLVTYSGSYELRPYWDVRMFLDEIATGNVFGITVFIWANTGEIISYSNMADGGINYADNANPSNVESQPAISNNNTLVAVALTVIAVIIAASAISLIIKKNHK